MDKVKWAVVGSSNFALDWIARGVSLGSNAHLAAIVSRDVDRARAAATRTGAQHAYTSIDEIDTNEVDGVFIVTPNPFHAPLAIAAAKRGLHVIVEKPMAPTSAECQAMIDAAQEAGVVLAVAHCMEWASPVVRARELVADGTIGKVVQVTIGSSFNSPPDNQWRQNDSTEAGGGSLYDMGVHAIDTIQRIVEPINNVAAFSDHFLYDYPADDLTSTLVRFASGAHGIVQSHMTCSQNNLEIIGTKGKLISNQWLGREFAGDLALEQGGKRTQLELPHVNVYVPQIEHVSACVYNGSTPIISGERGRDNVRVIEAAVKSARTGHFINVVK